MSLPPGSNSQPVILPGKNGMNTVSAINGRVYNPVVIDSSANVKTLGANSNYTLGGSEKYVNSGFILPMGQEKDILALQIHLLLHLRKQEHTTTYALSIRGW